MEVTLIVAFIAGIAIGMLAVGFLAMGAYDRGYSDALFRRKDWRAELIARQQVATTAFQRASRKAS